MSKQPVVLELDEDTVPLRPDEADPVPEVYQGVAMQQLSALATRRPISRLARWFWGGLSSLLVFVATVATYDYLSGLLARSPVLGGIATILLAVVIFALVLLGVRELAAFGRIRRVDQIQKRAAEALSASDLGGASNVVKDLKTLYAARPDTEWGRARLNDLSDEILDADGLLQLAETSVLVPLDALARAEIEAASRQVATVTAIVPLALADLFVALSANLRMIRRIAEIYGGRSGTFGSWRLTRSVFAHLVATGAVAVGDDLIGSVAGGGVLSKVSRRFGEGIINGALTARVGVAAMEVCRPLPFMAAKKPSVSGLVKQALTGLFASKTRS